VAEVLSSSTARHDRFIKRRRYLASGVAVYWIIDLEARVFEEWRPGAAAPVVLTRSAEWRPDPGVASLTIDLPTWFGRVLGT
jgi:Uma2 family endonuclease